MSAVQLERGASKETFPQGAEHRHSGSYASCPRCGSGRLRHVSGLRDLATRALTGKRHYRCSNCGWQGLKHRLRGHANKAAGRGHRRPVERRTVVLALLLGLSAFWLLFHQRCEQVTPEKWNEKKPDFNEDWR